MKQAKFAPVTAALLVRKGEPRQSDEGNPHAEGAPETVDFLSRAFRQSAKDLANEKSPVAASCATDAASTRPRKLTLRLAQSDYERLNLIATKRDTTRQRLLHHMLDEFLFAAADEYGANCECIGRSCQRHY